VNISKPQQRTLHALAQGGRIVVTRDGHGRPLDAELTTHEGWRLSDCNLAVFKKLRSRGLIASQNGQPYRITREGLRSLRAQLDNRVGPKRW
jgi:uncharacterized protein YjhX (UPF0386 family)